MYNLRDKARDFVELSGKTQRAALSHIQDNPERCTLSSVPLESWREDLKSTSIVCRVP